MVKARGTITLARVDDGKDAAIQSDTAPSDKTKLWYDTANNVFKSWDGSTWKVVNEVQVGGRNLLFETSGSTMNVIHNEWLPHGTTSTSDTYHGCYIYRANKPWAGIEFIFNKIVERSAIKVGDVLTYSIKCKTDDPTHYGVFLIANYMDNNESSGMGSSRLGVPYTDWVTLSHTFTYTQSVADQIKAGRSIRMSYEIGMNPTAADKYYYFACPKLEFGNKATDWTPAPEDVDSSINDAKDSANNAQESANTAISSVNDIRTSFGEYKDEVRAEFSSTVEYVDGKTEVVDNWIRQGTDGVNPYLELGGTGNSLKARLTNSRLGFYEGDKGLAYFGNNKAYMPDADIDRANIEQIQIGSYVWINNSDGHLTLVYIG